MKILNVVNISFVIPYFLGNQLNHFSEKGSEEFIVCTPAPDLERMSKDYDFKYKEVEISRSISITKDIKAILKTIKYIRANSIDVVSGHTPKGGMIAMVSAFLSGVKKRIYFRHGLVYETAHGLKRSILINVDRFTAFLATDVIVVSPSVAKRSMVDKLNSERKQHLLCKGTCNGIDVERFSKFNINTDKIGQLKVKYNIPPDNIIIGYVGRLVQDKGIVDLIKAYKVIKEHKSNVTLLLVGMLEKRDALDSSTVEYIGNNASIVCTGFIDNEEIQDYYGMMDIFILPSYREGFPTSVLEASAMNKPVITTRVTGCVDSIIDGSTGFFVSHDGNDMADKLELLIDKPLLRQEMGAAGRKFVTENFNQSLIWEEINKIYSER